ARRADDGGSTDRSVEESRRRPNSKAPCPEGMSPEHAVCCVSRDLPYSVPIRRVTFPCSRHVLGSTPLASGFGIGSEPRRPVSVCHQAIVKGYSRSFECVAVLAWVGVRSAALGTAGRRSACSAFIHQATKRPIGFTGPRVPGCLYDS